jgi:hypothetical protein
MTLETVLIDTPARRATSCRRAFDIACGAPDQNQPIKTRI